jgi:hypothetical protein
MLRRASNTSVNPLTALLNFLPANKSSAVFPASTPESAKRSQRPPSALLTKVEELFEDHVQPLICKFRQWGCDASPTFKYWDMFLVAVQIMLSNVRAERERDWSAHLMSSSKMLPYFFITNCTNYSRWMPVYIFDMLDLSAEIKSAFEKGEFFIRHQHKLSCISSIHARINQKITKTAMGPKFPYRR